MMAALLSSGQITIPILLLTVVEAAGLLALHRFSGRGVAPRDFLPNLLAGDFLLLAWLANADHAAWPWIGAACFAALAAHVTDLARRWRAA
jgi:hypothetical protein